MSTLCERRVVPKLGSDPNPHVQPHAKRFQEASSDHCSAATSLLLPDCPVVRVAPKDGAISMSQVDVTAFIISTPQQRQQAVPQPSTPVQRHPDNKRQQLTNEEAFWALLPSIVLLQLAAHQDTRLLRQVCKAWCLVFDQAHQAAAETHPLTLKIQIPNGSIIQPIPTWCQGHQVQSIHLLLGPGNVQHKAGSVEMPLPAFGPGDVRELSHTLVRLYSSLQHVRPARSGLQLYVAAPGSLLQQKHVHQAMSKVPGLVSLVAMVNVATS